MEKETVSKQTFIELLNEEMKRHARYRGGPEVKDLGYDPKNQIYWHFFSPHESSDERERLANEHAEVIEEVLAILQEQYEFK